MLPQSSLLKIGLAQINPVVGDIRGNLALIQHSAAQFPDDIDLIVFPEMVLTGYPPEDLLLKPCFITDCTQAIEDLCFWSQDQSVTLIIPAPHQLNGILYNALYVLEKGNITHIQHKYHLPNHGVFDEKRLFNQGKLPDPINIKGISIGFMICEDMWHDDVAQHLKNKGAEILLITNASPFEQNKQAVRLHHTKKHVQTTALPLLYVNQWGGQDELVFDGSSFSLNPDGEIILQSPVFSDDFAVIQYDPQKHRLFTATKSVFETNPMAILYKALVTGLRDYCRKNHFQSVLLGLSGGIDSALVAVLAVDALGADRVQAYMLPSQYTSQDSLDDAALLAQNLGISLATLPIEAHVQTLKTALNPHIDDHAPSITFENMQSRMRGIMLMTLSNASNALLLTTGNKSEMAVGYATLYGDMCGGFNPIKDVYKTQIYDLCQWINENYNGLMPDNILTKAPTAELRANQTDQDSLPEYEILDSILISIIEHQMSPSEIVAQGHDINIVQKIWRLVDLAEYKRRQSVIGTKITAMNFGRDRRYPITNGYKPFTKKANFV
jgi:NAD+ synthase